MLSQSRDETRETEWNGSEKDGEYMQTDRRDRLRRLLIRSTELEIAVGIHWPELWGGLAALWATIGSLGMFPPLFLPTTPLTVYTEYTGIVILVHAGLLGYWSSLAPEHHVLPTSPSPAIARPYTSLPLLLWPEVHPPWSTSDFYLVAGHGVRTELGIRIRWGMMLVYSRYHETLFRRSKIKVDHSFEMYLWRNFFSFVKNKKI